jgi:hypothetical protein
MLLGCNRAARRVGCGALCAMLVLPAVFAAGARGQSNMPTAPPQLVRAASVPQLTSSQQAQFSAARAAAERILARPEFQRPPPSLWDRAKAMIVEAIVRLFTGIDRVTSRSPWMGRTLEWLLFVAAAIGLVVWVMRTIQRQRLRVNLGSDAAKAAEWARKSDDWRRLAEQEAGRGAWREAIHALYWAAISELERRRLWRQDPARTPRDYVRLLKPGSPEQHELRGLTTALERSWYAQRAATPDDFGEARKSFDRIATQASSPDAVVAGGEL